MGNNNISFTDYDKITDTLMWLSDDVRLVFSTVFMKSNKYGEKRFFHFETMYGQNKYTDNPYRYIRRNMDFYFIIEDKNEFNNGILLRPQDVYTLLAFIEQHVLPWYFGNSKQNAFKIIDNKLILGQYQPTMWAQSTEKYIEFEPYVLEFEDGTATQAIKLNINSKNTIIMNVDKFMGMVQILGTDMYSVAATNAVYAKTPPYGVNVLDSRGLGGGRFKSDSNSDWNMNYNGNSASSFLNNANSKKK